MVRVKICGVTSVEDALWAQRCGADAIGLNFCARSPRHVSLELAREIAAALPETLLRVGVFVDAPRQEIEAALAGGAIGAVQLHGDESEDFCRGWPVPVIKAVRVRSAADLAAAMHWAVDFILADAYVEGARGGTGMGFDWSLLAAVDVSRLFLAGGLSPANVAAAVRRVRPYAVDAASGVERSPGIKDPAKVEEFIRNAKTA